jgi:aminodeoxyfutalosine synthase
MMKRRRPDKQHGAEEVADAQHPLRIYPAVRHDAKKRRRKDRRNTHGPIHPANLFAIETKHIEHIPAQRYQPRTPHKKFQEIHDGQAELHHHLLNFHIEPTNVCVFTCNFCSYSRVYAHRDEGWEMTQQQMLDIVKSYDGKPVTEVHIVGGVHPKMNLEFFAEVLQKIKAHRPGLHIKGFTAVELDYMFRKAKLTVEEGMKRLHAAVDAEGWLQIHEAAHRLGMHTNATMLYGHIETYAHRIDHMNRLRELQDKTGGFNTFIPLKFRNRDNDMSNVAESTIVEDMKLYAVARLFMDNFPHLKAYWPMLGRQNAQLTLAFGVNDLDGTIDDTTKIYSMAGSEEQTPSLSTAQLVALIRQVGREPVERDTLYHEVRNYKDIPIEELMQDPTLN